MSKHERASPELLAKSGLVQKDRIEILLFEYSALRAEVLTRTGYGFQLSAIFVGIVTWVVQGATPNASRFLWAAVGGLVVLFFLGVTINSRDLTRAASRVKEIEHEINSRAGEHLLVWESLQGVMSRMGLVRSYFSRISAASRDELPPLDPRYIANSPVIKE